MENECCVDAERRREADRRRQRERERERKGDCRVDCIQETKDVLTSCSQYVLRYT